MKKFFVKALLLFGAVAFAAEEIDAEIIRYLDFYQNLPVLEDMDLMELRANTEGTGDVNAPNMNGADGVGKEAQNENSQ